MTSGHMGLPPERMGYLPVRKAARLGVHTASAARCCVSLTPPSASRSMFGVLVGRGRAWIVAWGQHTLVTLAHPRDPSVSLTGQGWPGDAHFTIWPEASWEISVQHWHHGKGRS